jgi:hypothetical protein
MVKLFHISLGMSYHILNVYIPNNYWEKAEHWESLLKIGEVRFTHNCIITGDFNTNMHQREKIGGSIVRDSSKENMEDLLSSLDLIDVPPSEGKFTWNNRRAGPRHIVARLDRFLIHTSFMSLPEFFSSCIIPWESSDKLPTSLSFSKVDTLGPIPFRFNLLWIEKIDLFPLVTRSWCEWIFGSPVHIWEQNIKITKETIKNWVKESIPDSNVDVI